MIELYLSKVTETSESEQAGKLHAHVALDIAKASEPSAVHQ